MRKRVESAAVVMLGDYEGDAEGAGNRRRRGTSTRKLKQGKDVLA